MKEYKSISGMFYLVGLTRVFWMYAGMFVRTKAESEKFRNNEQ